MTENLPLANLPSLTRGLVELFEGPLRDVRFPDADLDGLTRAIEEGKSARDALVRAELAVQAARQCLDEQNALIARRTERGLAYARIYASERPELLEAVESVAALVDAQAPRPRGRPRKERSAFTPPEPVPPRQVELAEMSPSPTASAAVAGPRRRASQAHVDNAAE